MGDTDTYVGWDHGVALEDHGYYPTARSAKRGLTRAMANITLEDNTRRHKVSEKDTVKPTEVAVLGNQEESTNLPAASEVVNTMQAIEQFQHICMEHLVEGADYSKPGLFGKGSKPSLLKAGAEKIMSILGCRPDYTILTEQEDFDKPLFYYKFRCQMIHIKTGEIWGDGIGSSNSKESRYKSKYSKDFEFQNVNTIQKMAQKRAMVQSVLTMGRLSNIFTQDIEDYTKPSSSGGKQKTKAKPPVDSELTSTELHMIKQWTEEYPFVKELLKKWKIKQFSKITVDQYVEISERVTEEEASKPIEEDVPF